VALSGSVDFSNDDPRIALGLASNRMTIGAMKRLWPDFIASHVRDWVEEHVLSGAVERVVIAVNAPLSTLKEDGPPVPDEGLSIDIVGSGTVLQPVDSLPPIRDAALSVRVTGRTAVVNVPHGSIELPSGRKLTLTNGIFEVPDTVPKAPLARARFRVDGSVSAAAELLASERLRDFSGAPFDPASSRGSLTAQVALALPLVRDLPKGSTDYSINVDLANFAADRMVMGQRVEAQTLKILADKEGFLVKGDAKIGGMPATLEYRKPKGDADADLRIQTTLDEAGRSRLGFDLGTAVSGPVPIKAVGKIASNDRDYRLSIDADLTAAKVENVLPGWVKPAGKAARATFVLINKPQSTRIEDLVIDGSGTSMKGSIEIDTSGDLVSANFPVFSPSDGDKAALKADRAADGTLRVSMRGEVYDGRGFLKSAMAGSSAERKAKRPEDLDLDIKLGAVAGHHGEALRALELKLSRRAGHIRTFSLGAKLGRDTPLIGDLRGRGGRQVLYLETNDAGALFRLTDVYPRMNGGQMWVAMDPPTSDPTPQDGTLTVRDFAIRGEAALERAVSGSQAARNAVAFSRMNVQFTRTPGKLAVRDGVVKGPTIGATIDGTIDYGRDDVRMRGTLVPLYGLNNMFGQLPIVGLFLGGSNEGLVGITYEVVGTPSTPVLRVNPISAGAPGLLRKLFEFPSGDSREPPAGEGRAAPAR
jgi:hypothetical protein